MVRGSKDLSEKQDPGVGLLGEGGGKPMKWSQTFFKNERKKGQKSKPKREWHSYPPLWPLGTEQQVVVSNPPQKKQGRLKRKRSPIPYPKPVNKIGSLSSRKKRLQGETTSAESFVSHHRTPFQGSNPTPRCSLLVHFSLLCLPGMSFFYLNKRSKVRFC